MKTINLLPWREQQAKEKRENSLFSLLIITSLLLSTLLLIHLYLTYKNKRFTLEIKTYQDKIQHQEAVNKHLTSHFTTLRTSLDYQEAGNQLLKLLPTLPLKIPPGITIHRITAYQKNLTICGTYEILSELNLLKKIFRHEDTHLESNKKHHQFVLETRLGTK